MIHTLINNLKSLLLSENIDGYYSALQTILSLSREYKTEIGEQGIIPLIVNLLGFYYDDDDTELRIKSTAIHSIHLLCIANPNNKKRSICALESILVSIKCILHKLPKLETTHHLKIMQDILYQSGMAIWSICYGIPENVNFVLLQDGISPLIKMLKISDPYLIGYAAAGALWHLSDSPQACQKIYDYNGIAPLVELTKEDKDDCIVPCLALANIASNGPDLVGEEALRCIDQFLLKKDPFNFNNPFVWTTVKPLVTLLESKNSSIKLLGTFLAIVTVKAKSSTANLFMEGAVKQLKEISETEPDHSPHSGFARAALRELGIFPTKSNPSPPPSFPSQDIHNWLTTLHLSEFFGIFSKNGITMENIMHLSEEDLHSLGIPIGPRKKIFRAIQSLLRGTLGCPLPMPVELKGDDKCLICCEGVKEACLVPCGHVATCEQCAQILCARNDTCIVCRAVIQTAVKVYYV